MSNPYDEEIPSALEQATGLFARHAQSEYSGVVFPSSIRMPLFTYAYVEALTRHAEPQISRNRTMCELLWVGIEAVLRNLPSEDREAIDVLFQQIAGDAAKQAGLTSEVI